MMYKDRFVVAVKCEGRILREKDGVVYLPFGSEYSILLKNLESRKASVKISIDGRDALDGKSLLLAPNSSMDLERFIESLDRGNRFKFIQKTKEIIEHRGDRIDDGIVRVEFAFEQVTKYVNVEHYHYHNDWPYYPTYPWYPQPWITWKVADCSMTCSASNRTINLDTVYLNQNDALSSKFPYSDPLPDEGITVKGSESNQCFHEDYIGVLDSSEVIILRLRGENSAGVGVEKPITVKDKLECNTCGNSLLPTVNFCEKCGTALSIR